MSLKSRSGLVSYGGDSEISDSEDERASISTSPPIVSETILPTIKLNNLGIPSSQPRTFSSPPTLPTPIVHAAPTTALVDYVDDDHNDSKGDPSAGADEIFLPNIESEAQDDDEINNADGSEKLSQACRNGSYFTRGSSTVPLFLETTNILLPPEPTTKCSKNIQNKIIGFLQKKVGSGIDLNSNLQQKKDLRNPSIYEKLIEFCNLDEFGTNYPRHLYNPKEWTEESYYDNLFKDQKKEHVRKEKARLAEHTTIEFVTGTKRPAISASKVEATRKQRRSKWDIGTGSGPESGGSRGTSPSGSRDRIPLLGNAPLGMQPRVLQSGTVGAQARVQASQLSKELSKAK